MKSKWKLGKIKFGGYRMFRKNDDEMIDNAGFCYLEHRYLYWWEIIFYRLTGQIPTIFGDY